MIKSGEYVLEDETEQIAKGVLLVPNYVDEFGDFFQPETIEDLAQSFLPKIIAGDATIKLQHTRDASKIISLQESSVLLEPTEIGGTVYPIGSWYVSVKVHDDDLWELFEDNVITGFSIGADSFDSEQMTVSTARDRGIELEGEFESRETVVNEVTSANLVEFSPVDEPAVPPAQVEILKSKGDGVGFIDRLNESRESAFELLLERGHTPEDARQFANIIHDLPANDMLTHMGGATNLLDEHKSTPMRKQDYTVDSWVTWQRSEGDTRGQIVEVETEEGEGFSQAISGDVTVNAEEDNPVYLIEVWDGFGDDASPREDESGRGDTQHVANREDQIVQEVQDPREREKSRLTNAINSLRERLNQQGNTETVSDCLSESEAKEILSKTGRTLSKENVMEAKTVHDATERMLEREGVKGHSGDVRTYTMDKSDDFDIRERDGDMGEDKDGDSKKMKSEQKAEQGSIPMLYFPTEEEAERYAEEEMGVTGSHTHMLNGQQFYMPASSHKEYETIMSEKDMSPEMSEIADVVREVVSEMMETEEMGTEEMSNESKSSEVMEKMDELSEQIDDIDERVDRLSKSTAETGQSGGTEETENENEESTATQFKKALGGGGRR